MFAKVVDLYRSTGRKPVVDGAFSYEGAYDKGLADKLEALKELPQHFGRFLEVETSPEKGAHLLLSYHLMSTVSSFQISRRFWLVAPLSIRACFLKTST